MGYEFHLFCLQLCIKTQKMNTADKTRSRKFSMSIPRWFHVGFLIFTTFLWFPSQAQNYYGRFKVVQYNLDGSLDKKYEAGVRNALPSANAYRSGGANAVSVDIPNNKVLSAGFGRFQGGSRFVIQRQYEFSYIDSGFGDRGQVTTDFRSTPGEEINAMVLDHEGKIVVGGRAGSLFALARYNPDGSLDRTFDGDGKVLTDFGSSSFEMIYAIDLDYNGKIVAAGLANVGGHGHQFALARYNRDGSLDRTFDGDGKVLTNFTTSSSEEVHGLAIDEWGKIVVVGNALVDGQNQFALARYNENGSLDNSFHHDGRLLTNFTTSTHEAAFTVVIDRLGKIFAGGYATIGGGKRFALAKYNYDGSLDLGFHQDGRVVTDFRSTSHEMIKAIGITSANKIVVAGSAGDLRFPEPDPIGAPSTTRFALAQYHYNGNLDQNFDGDGKVLTNLSPGCVAEGATALSTARRGKIVVAGYSYLK